MEQAQHLYRWSLVDQIVIVILIALVTLYVLTEQAVYPYLWVSLYQLVFPATMIFVNIQLRSKHLGTTVQVVNISKSGQAIIVPRMVSLT